MYAEQAIRAHADVSVQRHAVLRRVEAVNGDNRSSFCVDRADSL
jgi:hypothetical protein